MKKAARRLNDAVPVIQKAYRAYVISREKRKEHIAKIDVERMFKFERFLKYHTKPK